MKSKKWFVQAVVLGSVFFLAAFLVKPVGVSTQFNVLGGVIQNVFDSDLVTEDDSRESGYRSTNAYYDKDGGKIAKEIANPINYDFIFVLAIPLGAYLGYALTDKRKKSRMSDVGERNDDPEGKQSVIRVYGPSFLGGFILLFGARMAGGCTSGHMMSGMMQGSVSGYLFAACVFIVAIPTAIIMGRRGR